jgi:hypothetical protein
MTPLTVPEARAILIASEALHASYEARLATGQTFGLEELNAWAKLIKNAEDRIALFEGKRKEAPTPPPSPPAQEPDRYPGGNELGFQTQFLLAMEAGAAKRRESLAAQLDTGPAWLADLAEALGKIAPSGKPLALNWTQVLELVRQLRRDLLAVCSIATTPLPEDRQTVVEARKRWL